MFLEKVKRKTKNQWSSKNSVVCILVVSSALMLFMACNTLQTTTVENPTRTDSLLKFTNHNFFQKIHTLTLVLP